MDYTALGNRIRESRIRQNYTQMQVAEQLLFSQKHIGNIERGNARPSIDLLVGLANTLEVSLDYLLQDSLTFRGHNSGMEITATIEQYLERQQSELSKLKRNLEYLRGH